MKADAILGVNNDLAVRLDEPDGSAATARKHSSPAAAEMDRAIADFDQVARLDSPNPAIKMAANLNRGVIFLRRGDPGKAIVEFDEAIARDPKDALAFSNRGVAWARKGDSEKAQADFKEAIRLDPAHPTAYINRSELWVRKSDYNQAVAGLGEAIQANPQNAELRNLRARALRFQGKHQLAIDDYSESLQLDAKNAEACCKLAWIWATCPDPSLRSGAQAVAFADRACELTQWKDANALDALAAAQAEKGDFAAAVQSETKALAAAPPNNEKMQGAFHTRLELYKSGKPYHEEPRKGK